MTDPAREALAIAIEALRDFEADACVCPAPPSGHRFACPAQQHRYVLARIDAILTGDRQETSDLGDRIRSEAAIADRPGQGARLECIAAEVDDR